MKKIGIIFLLAMTFSVASFAALDLAPLLNKVTLQLQAEDWLTTQTALVDVGINTAVSDKGVERVQGDVLAQLKRLSDKATWHILSYNRQQDQSGLESIQMIAQARLPQSELSGLRTKAKSMSKPGETYTIDNIQFTPSTEDVMQMNNTLRNNIYNQAKLETDTLNKIYPGQNYYLHQIDFVTQEPVMLQSRNYMTMAKGVAPAAAPPLNVGNKLKVQAVVVLAAMPTVVAQQIAKP